MKPEIGRRAENRLSTGLLLLLLAAGCERAAAPAGGAGARDPAAGSQAMQEHTETLLLIHLRLDSAATELARAEEQAQGGNHAAADYHVSEARRHLDAADDAVLQLGQDLQEAFNLDAASANSQ
jgi:hypothetical protein